LPRTSSRPRHSSSPRDVATRAVISGGPRTTFVPSGTVWIIDLRTRKVVATVTGVGNDPYGLAIVERGRD
jgi:YVTN family beta-propeller protein